MWLGVFALLTAWLGACGSSSDSSGSSTAGAGLGGDGGEGGPGGNGGGPTGSGGSPSAGSGGVPSAGSGGAPNPPLCDAGSTPIAGFHVSTTGSADGDGSAQRPWDLKTALLQPAAVHPGDTIWVHGGVYTGGWVGKLTGVQGNPVTARSYPGEWAVLDGRGSTEPTLQIYHAYGVYRDLEITNSEPDRSTDRPSGIYVEGASIQLINLVVHDVGTGVICNSATDTTPELAPELEVYGCLLYNNGFNAADRAHGHHLYLQNRDGTKHIHDNILFHAFAFGVHAYSDDDAHYAQGYDIAGNVWFDNGAASAGISKLYDSCMVGHNGTHPVARLSLHENYGWASGPDERDVRLGWAANNEDVTLTDNYFVGQPVCQPAWASVTMTGNTFYGSIVGVDAGLYPNNTYVTARPTDSKVVVRANQYQPGRAHIIVYNWGALDSVDVDVSGVLQTGMHYELRNAQDYFAEPVQLGTWQSGPIHVPMTGLTVAQPIGTPDAIDPSEMTGKDFNVFVLASVCSGT